MGWAKIIEYALGIINGILARFQQAHDEQNGANQVKVDLQGKELQDVARRQEVDADVHKLTDAQLNDELRKLEGS